MRSTLVRTYKYLRAFPVRVALLSLLLIGAVTWGLRLATAALDPHQGPGGPVLIVTSGTSNFGKYYAEILRSEGLNSFAVADITSVSASTLSAYDVVVLAKMALTTQQADMLTTWVNAGGHLIAMAPAPQLSGLLGLSPLAGSLNDRYLRVDTATAVGSGIVGETMQFHGSANLYALNGASSLATLYSSATLATTNPAITQRSVGSNGGQAVAFAYDLATSIVYTRQGNPAWATQERDGFAPVRSDDKFFGAAAGDPQPDWIDRSKIAIPQADEQQRLLVKLITRMNLDKRPLPRFWYFPNGKKAVVIMTGDDHGNGGTAGRFEQFKSASPAGCLVDNWECVRGTSYVYPATPGLTNAQAAAYTADGFEVGLHINTACADFTPTSLEAFYVQQGAQWGSAYPSIPAPNTQRHHCIAWSDWASAAKVQLNHGMRLDTSYYYWPPGWVNDTPGLFTGSAMPMRFADLDGTIIDVYNVATQMTDESGQSYAFTADALLGRAVGPEGYYGAYTVNAHTDSPISSVADAVVASALARGVPVVSSRQMLTWLDARNQSSFSAIAWDGSALSFAISADAQARGLQAMLPRYVGNKVLATVTRNGSAVSFNLQTIKGEQYAFLSALSGGYAATYAIDTTAPQVSSTLPAGAANGVDIAASVSAVFSETMDPATITAATFELRDSANNLIAAAVSYDGAGLRATLSPNSPLSPATAYTARIRGGASDPRAKDSAGNALLADAVWTFTTGAGPACPCSAWGSSAVPGNPSDPDTNPVELGVKFRSDLAGLITGVRFYKGNANTGTHVGNLWTSAGQLLATAAFTNESASGWQQVNFAAPVAITAGTVYVASYFAPNGRYAGDNAYFANSGVDNGPIHLLRDGESGGNGVYRYGASSGFPNSTYQASNYWVDVVFVLAAGGSDTVAPTVTATSPAGGAGNISATATLNATFSELMNASTINSSTFQVRDVSNALVDGAVSYNAATLTATFTPSAPLSAPSAYNATLRGGTTEPSVKDVAGNALATDFSWSFTTVADPCSAAPNAIVAENCRSGNPASEWDISGAGDPSIQGFATEISVNRGTTVFYKINTTAANYRIDIYRIGYYGGMGARKVATVLPTATLPQQQPACLTTAATGLIDCGNWAVSGAWAVPANATSGVYIAKLVRSDTGGASHIIFIVRDDASTSDLLFQTSDTTWQAYNNYGGNSLYTGSPAGRAYKVSYNRPFNTRAVDAGQDWFFNAEYPMVRWLEANGYDVSYFTGVDSDRFPVLMRNHKAILSVGHDEYWSGAQRANFEAARDAGVHLAFFSGNEVFWKTRWENGIDASAAPYRTLVCYKETHAGSKIDPSSVWTGTWRDPRFSPPSDGGRPENALTGTLFMVNAGATTAINVPAAEGKMRFWRNTSVASLATGTSATLPQGTLGYEWDVDSDNGMRPAGLTRLSATTVPNAPVLQDHGSTYASGTASHHLTLYRDASRALVFGAGSVQWAWGLDANHDRAGTPADIRMRQATVNLLADMGAQPSTLQADLVQATASTDVAPPISSIISPIAGANLPTGVLVSMSGSATDSGGGVVGAVEVSVDGGVTWRPATGRSSWNFNWLPTTPGSATIKVRSVDDSGNMEVPGTGINVTIGATDTTPPSVTATAPAAGAAGVSVGTSITAVFSEALDPLTINATTFELRTQANTLVPATLSYNNTTLTAVLTPSNALAAATTYTASLRGGASGARVTDLAGNPLASTFVWSFTTASADTTAPAAPSGLSVSATASGINVAWSANAEADLAGYHVYRASSASGPFTRLNAALLAELSYEDTLAPSGTSYYALTAVDTTGNESVRTVVQSASMDKANRLANPGFELDANNNTRPDSWTSDTRVTRSALLGRSGGFAMRHFSTSNPGYTITQVVSGLSAGTPYTFAGWTNIPTTSDAFNFTLRIRWRNASNAVLRTDVVRVYNGATAGWNKASANLVAPAGTTNAQVQMVVSSLNANIYVDDFALR